MIYTSRWPGVLLSMLGVLLTGCATSGTLLDGREKSFVIVGYSTSYAWPDMLQDMLDQHAGGERVYHVLNAVQGGAAVERWNADPGTQYYERTMTAMRNDFFGPEARLRGDAPQPTIALCQQSLQFTRSLRGPIPSEADEEGIRIGADAFEKFAMRLRDTGIEEVYIGCHIYKKPVEPEVGNERLALAAVLERGHDFIFEGPDVWEPTRDEHPDAFTADGVHPNERGMKIMAEGWYRTVAGQNASEDIIAKMYKRHYDVDTMMVKYLDWRRGGQSTESP